jgi:hypothetical protein
MKWYRNTESLGKQERKKNAKSGELHWIAPEGPVVAEYRKPGLRGKMRRIGKMRRMRRTKKRLRSSAPLRQHL